MKINIQQKKIQALHPTDILFQTAYWSRVKSHLGWKPAAFDFQSSTGQQGDILLLTRPLNNGLSFACVPQGPESGPDPEKYGLFLEVLSRVISEHVDSPLAFIRYDLPWESQYAADAADGQTWPGHPAARLRELRMNQDGTTPSLPKGPVRSGLYPKTNYTRPKRRCGAGHLSMKQTTDTLQRINKNSRIITTLTIRAEYGVNIRTISINLYYYII